MHSALALSSGLAFAATRQCSPDRDCNGTRDDDKRIGTSRPDGILGTNGDDRLVGRRTMICTGAGKDKLFGGVGNPASFDDKLDGGEGGTERYFYFVDAWGRDTVIDTAVSGTDPSTGNKIDLQTSVTTPVTINLVSGSGPAP